MIIPVKDRQFVQGQSVDNWFLFCNDSDSDLHYPHIIIQPGDEIIMPIINGKLHPEYAEFLDPGVIE